MDEEDRKEAILAAKILYISIAILFVLIIFTVDTMLPAGKGLWDIIK